MSDPKYKGQFAFVFREERKLGASTVTALADRRPSEHAASVQKRLSQSGVFAIKGPPKKSR